MRLKENQKSSQVNRKFQEDFFIGSVHSFYSVYNNCVKKLSSNFAFPLSNKQQMNSFTIYQFIVY